MLKHTEDHQMYSREEKMCDAKKTRKRAKGMQNFFSARRDAFLCDGVGWREGEIERTRRRLSRFFSNILSKHVLLQVRGFSRLSFFFLEHNNNKKSFFPC